MTDSSIHLPMLDGLFQTCYVTLDLDAAMRTLADRHGISRFRIKRDVSSLPGMPVMRVNQAHVFIGPMQIELIQPAGGDDAIYRDVCSRNPSELRHHHFGLWVDEARYATLRTVLAAQHTPIAFEAVVPGIGGAIYADTRASLGHYLEYVCLPPDVRAKYYADVPVY